MIAATVATARRHPWLAAAGVVGLVATAMMTFAVLSAMVALSRYDDFDGRFRRSRPALDAYAGRVLAVPPDRPLPPLPTKLGEFTPADCERVPSGFLFFCDYGHPLDANGLAYVTRPPPATQPAANGRVDLLKHVAGNWYTVLRN